MERTLIILKPDTVQRGIVGEILSRFEKAGLKIVGSKMLHPSYDHYFHHYETIGKLKTRRGDRAFDVTLDLMQEGPVLAYVLEGVESVELVRKMVGPTEPKNAPPGTIRGDYAHVSFSQADKVKKGIANVVHASADAKEAEAEINHWFSESDLFDYEASHEKFTQPRK
jgi:nucleoside-diphosphate kinase